MNKMNLKPLDFLNLLLNSSNLRHIYLPCVFSSESYRSNIYLASKLTKHAILYKKIAPVWDAILVFGADEQIRTAYLLITNEVLYRLSYISAATNIIAKPAVHCKC